MLKKYQPRKVTILISNEKTDESLATFSLGLFDITNPYTRNGIQDIISGELDDAIETTITHIQEKANPHVLSLLKEYEGDYPECYEHEKILKKFLYLMIIEDIIYHS